VPGDHDISSYCPWFDARHWNHHELFRSGARLAPDALGVFALPREREAIADHPGMSAYRLQAQAVCSPPVRRRCLRDQYQFLSVASADGSAGMTDGGSGHAAASDQCPTWAACEANLHDRAVRLRNRRRRYCLRRSCDGYDKASNGNQPDHSYPPFFTVGFLASPSGLQTAGYASELFPSRRKEQRMVPLLY
jgi:hypothetical protein